MAALLDVNDKRGHQRWRAILAGKIVFSNRGSVFDCSIRNISHSGAKLWVFNSASVPDCFDLEIEARGISRRACVVWRSAKEVGVRFVD